MNIVIVYMFINVFVMAGEAGRARCLVARCPAGATLICRTTTTGITHSFQEQIKSGK